MEFKQIILVRNDLKLSKGKLAAQVGHSCVEAVLKSNKNIVSKWRILGQKKIVLKVDCEKDLFYYKNLCEDTGIVCALIKDAGHTELKPGTITCLGIGPDYEEKIDKVTKDLKML